MSAHDCQLAHRAHVTELRSRYDEFFKRFSDIDAVVLYSGSAVIKNTRDDQYWPVSTTPHFAHWTPYRETPAVLIVRPSQKPSLLKEKHTSYWEGPGPSNTNWDIESFDIDDVESLKNAHRIGRCLYVGDDQDFRPQTAIDTVLSNQMMRYLDVIRTMKTPYEIESIKEATRIAAVGHNKLRSLFESGESLSELDLHYEYLKATRQTEFSEPYGDIVGMGENASILHHVHYDTTPRKGDCSLLVDAGATCNGLASDITRTTVRGQSAGAALFRELVRGVDDAQKRLCRQFVVGRPYEDLHNESHVEIANLLVRLNLSTASAEELVTSGATRFLYPHGVGHSLGIQVHDVGMKFRSPAKDNPYLRNTSIITSGQVVTVEPGVYFIESLLKRLAAEAVGKSFDWEKIALLKPFGGVRIEDNILATEAGPENLTRPYLP